METEVRYYYPISGNAVLCYFVFIAALIFCICDWIYMHIMTIALVAMIIALVLIALHSYIRIKSGANKFVTIVSSLVSECSSMLYFMLCLVQAVEYIQDDPILGLFPLFINAPLSFGAWLLIKQPSLVATVAPKTWLVACDGIITLMLVALFGWLFGLSSYIHYFI